MQGRVGRLPQTYSTHLQSIVDSLLVKEVFIFTCIIHYTYMTAKKKVFWLVSVISTPGGDLHVHVVYYIYT